MTLVTVRIHDSALLNNACDVWCSHGPKPRFGKLGVRSFSDRDQRPDQQIALSATQADRSPQIVSIFSVPRISTANPSRVSFDDPAYRSAPDAVLTRPIRGARCHFW